MACRFFRIWSVSKYMHWHICLPCRTMKYYTMTKSTIFITKIISGPSITLSAFKLRTVMHWACEKWWCWWSRRTLVWQRWWLGAVQSQAITKNNSGSVARYFFYFFLLGVGVGGGVGAYRETDTDKDREKEGRREREKETDEDRRKSLSIQNCIYHQHPNLIECRSY